MDKYLIEVETTNPHFVERLKQALDEVGLDLDENNQAKFLCLTVLVNDGDGVPRFRYGTEFDPDDGEDYGPTPYGRGGRNTTEQAVASATGVA